MNRLQTAERVSAIDPSDNFVYQRSLLAYHFAAGRIGGRVLELGTGSGYGVRVLAPHAAQFVTIDKAPAPFAEPPLPQVEFHRAVVPPIPFPDRDFDAVVSFQVIEHIPRDTRFVREVARVLRPGGQFILSTPNASMSLTRNPWHVREYPPDALQALLEGCFAGVECYGVFGNERVAAYYERNRECVERLRRLDPLDLQHRLPRWMLRIPYDVLNRINRRRLLRENRELTSTLSMEDYRVGPVDDGCYDLLYVAHKGEEEE